MKKLTLKRCRRKNFTPRSSRRKNLRPKRSRRKNLKVRSSRKKKEGFRIKESFAVVPVDASFITDGHFLCKLSSLF